MFSTAGFRQLGSGKRRRAMTKVRLSTALLPSHGSWIDQFNLQNLVAWQPQGLINNSDISTAFHPMFDTMTVGFTRILAVYR